MSWRDLGYLLVRGLPRQILRARCPECRGPLVFAVSEDPLRQRLYGAVKCPASCGGAVRTGFDDAPPWTLELGPLVMSEVDG